MCIVEVVMPDEDLRNQKKDVVICSTVYSLLGHSIRYFVLHRD